jgi:hypothetical protein
MGLSIPGAEILAPSNLVSVKRMPVGSINFSQSLRRQLSAGGQCWESKTLQDGIRYARTAQAIEWERIRES